MNFYMGKNLWNRERVSGLTWDCRTTPSPSVEWWAVVVWSRWLRRATPGRARGVPTLPTFILRVIKRVLKKQHPDLDPTVRLDIECDQKVLRSQVTIRNQAFFGHFKKTQAPKTSNLKQNTWKTPAKFRENSTTGNQLSWVEAKLNENFIFREKI